MKEMYVISIGHCIVGISDDIGFTIMYNNPKLNTVIHKCKSNDVYNYISNIIKKDEVKIL